MVDGTIEFPTERVRPSDGTSGSREASVTQLNPPAPKKKPRVTVEEAIAAASPDDVRVALFKALEEASKAIDEVRKRLYEFNLTVEKGKEELEQQLVAECQEKRET